MEERSLMEFILKVSVIHKQGPEMEPEHVAHNFNIWEGGMFEHGDTLVQVDRVDVLWPMDTHHQDEEEEVH
jgi:hypothetical protein